MTDRRKPLFPEFGPVTREQWLDKIGQDLKGADFDKRLVWRCPEGFQLQPFYTLDDPASSASATMRPGEYPYLRGCRSEGNDWLVRQEVECGDPAEAHAEVERLLRLGVTAPSLRIPKESVSPAYLHTLLDGLPQGMSITLRSCMRHAAALAEAVAVFLDETGENLQLAIDFDPVGKTLIKGRDKTPLLHQAVAMESALRGRQVPYLTVDTSLLRDAGCRAAEEMGYALAWGHDLLCLLMDQGLTAAQAASRLRFKVGIGTDYFMEIAKLRGLRALWAVMLKDYGCPDDQCRAYVVAVTSQYDKTLFDPYVNMLRTQTEAMSAALGGVDELEVKAFDSAYAAPSEFSQRIARNQQLLLREEAHFAEVADPAAGSYYIEHLTRELQQQAWALLLQTEKNGGFIGEIRQGSIQTHINAVNDERHRLAAQRREFMLGTNQYPNFQEPAPDIAAGSPAFSLGNMQPPASRHHCGCGGQCKSEAPLPKLNTDRLASEYEALRLSTAGMKHRPKAMMLTIGDLKWRQARAQFSCNFLACAGYEVEDHLGFETIEKGVETAINGAADIVVLCSSDDAYAELAPQAHKALAGRALLIVAGAPECMEALQQQGIDLFIHVRTNQLEMLRTLNAKLSQL